MKSHDPAKALIGSLTAQGITLAIAESLTGGLLCARICDIPGASKVFLDGVVCYSERAKSFRLDVSEKTLREYSPVSKEVAKEMAVGVRKTLDVDIGVSTTGVAGPGPDERGDPQGLFYIGIATREDVRVFRFQESGSRSEIREKAARYAIDILLDLFGNGS